MAALCYERDFIFIAVREEKVVGRDRRARLASSLRRAVSDINSRHGVNEERSRVATWLGSRLISTKYEGRADKRGEAAKIDFVSEILMLSKRSINLASSAYNARDSSLNNHLTTGFVSMFKVYDNLCSKCIIKVWTQWSEDQSSLCLQPSECLFRSCKTTLSSKHASRWIGTYFRHF